MRRPYLRLESFEAHYARLERENPRIEPVDRSRPGPLARLRRWWNGRKKRRIVSYLKIRIPEGD